MTREWGEEEKEGGREGRGREGERTRTGSRGRGGPAKPGQLDDPRDRLFGPQTSHPHPRIPLQVLSPQHHERSVLYKLCRLLDKRELPATSACYLARIIYGETRLERSLAGPGAFHCSHPLVRLALLVLVHTIHPAVTARVSAATPETHGPAVEDEAQPPNLDSTSSLRHDTLSSPRSAMEGATGARRSRRARRREAPVFTGRYAVSAARSQARSGPGSKQADLASPTGPRAVRVSRGVCTADAGE